MIKKNSAIKVFRLFYLILLLFMIFTGAVLLVNKSMITFLLEDRSAKRELTAAEYGKLAVTDDIELRTVAGNSIKGCSADDIECKTYRLFRYISQNKAAAAQFGQGPGKDEALFFSSLLANIGIENRLIVTESSLYVGVCGLSKERLYSLVKNDIHITVILSDSVRLARGKVWFAVPEVAEGGEIIEIHVKSSAGVSLYVFATKESMDINDKLSYFQECAQRGSSDILQRCFLQQGNVTAVYAPDSAAAFTILANRVIFAEEEILVKSYGGEQCVVFDPGISGEGLSPAIGDLDGSAGVITIN